MTPLLHPMGRTSSAGQFCPLGAVCTCISGNPSRYVSLPGETWSNIRTDNGFPFEIIRRKPRAHPPRLLPAIELHLTEEASGATCCGLTSEGEGLPVRSARISRPPSSASQSAQIDISRRTREARPLQKDFTIKELAENWDAHQAGEPLPHRVQGVITVHDDRDNGVTNTWNVELTGWPVEPHPTRGSVWVRIPDEPTGESGSRCLTYEHQRTRQRRYWISRQGSMVLPDPQCRGNPLLTPVAPDDGPAPERDNRAGLR